MPKVKRWCDDPWQYTYWPTLKEKYTEQYKARLQKELDELGFVPDQMLVYVKSWNVHYHLRSEEMKAKNTEDLRRSDIIDLDTDKSNYFLRDFSRWPFDFDKCVQLREAEPYSGGAIPIRKSIFYALKVASVSVFDEQLELTGDRATWRTWDHRRFTIRKNCRYCMAKRQCISMIIIIGNDVPCW